jgi:hypothetical protein
VWKHLSAAGRPTRTASVHSSGGSSQGAGRGSQWSAVLLARRTIVLAATQSLVLGGRWEQGVASDTFGVNCFRTAEVIGRRGWGQSRMAREARGEPPPTIQAAEHGSVICAWEQHHRTPVEDGL